MDKIITLPDGTTYGGLTINDLFRSLAEALLDRKAPQEHEQFKRAWIEGAKRMN